MLNTYQPNSQNNIYDLVKMVGSTTSHDNLYFFSVFFGSLCHYGQTIT